MGIWEVRRSSLAISSTLVRLAPAFKARMEERWITGPSAVGSENGTPSSKRSSPASPMALMILMETSTVGSPAVTNPTRAFSCLRRISSKSFVMRFMLLLLLQDFRPVPVRWAETMPRSLSPRPERLTMMICSGGRFTASSNAWATA